MIERIIPKGYKIIPKSISRYETGETASCGVVRQSERRRKPAISALKKIAKLVYWHLDDFYQKSCRASYAALIKYQQRNEPMLVHRSFSVGGGYFFGE